MEHPQDRPTFSQLRSKFSALLQATSDSVYIVLEVDEEKTYYNVGEEESSEDGGESESSEVSIRKIERPKWATRKPNTYVATPMTFKNKHFIDADRYQASLLEAEKEKSARNSPDISHHDNEATALQSENATTPPPLDEGLSSPAPQETLFAAYVEINAAALSTSPDNKDYHLMLADKRPDRQRDQVGSLITDLSFYLDNGKKQQETSTPLWKDYQLSQLFMMLFL